MKVQLQRIFIFVQIYLSFSDSKTVDENHNSLSSRHRLFSRASRSHSSSAAAAPPEASVCNSKNIPPRISHNGFTNHRAPSQSQTRDTKAKGWNTIEGGLKFSLWNYWSQRASPNTSLSLGTLFLSTISNCLSRWRKHRGPLDINTVTPRVLTVATSRKS